MLWKSAVFIGFRVIDPKLRGNYGFSQNFHTKKLGTIQAVFSLKSIFKVFRTKTQIIHPKNLIKDCYIISTQLIIFFHYIAGCQNVLKAS